MASGTTAQQTVDVVPPAAGESVTEGTILEWHVKVGDPIKVDETIVEISTDKVDIELPSPATGTVTEILIEEGETVTVGQVIARIAEGAVASKAAPAPTAAATAEPPAAAESSATAASQTAPAPPTADPRAPAEATPTAAEANLPEGTKVSPVAARAAAVEGVNLAQLSGSGPAGRITKSDVLSAAEGAPNGKAATQAAPETQPMKGGAAALARY